MAHKGMAVHKDDFKKALSYFASGVTIVTYRSQGEDSGITVSAFCSVSLEPPLVLVSIQKKSPAALAISQEKQFAVSILKEGQEDISNLFAMPDNSRKEYLQAQNPPRAHSGICYIPNSLVGLDCRLYAQYEGGDHWIFLGEVESVIFPNPNTNQEGSPSLTDGTHQPFPLIYYNRAYRKLHF